jgi:DNA-directed RNA polymerase subunit K/omega
MSNSKSKLQGLTNRTNTPVSIITRDASKIAEPTGNIYKSIVVIGKRSRQVATKMKEEINNKLSEFTTTVDNLEEIFENREQIEISRHFERQPKPSLIAVEEFLEGKVMFRSASENGEENAQ